MNDIDQFQCSAATLYRLLFKAKSCRAASLQAVPGDTRCTLAIGGKRSIARLEIGEDKIERRDFDWQVDDPRPAIVFDTQDFMRMLISDGERIEVDPSAVDHAAFKLAVEFAAHTGRRLTWAAWLMDRCMSWVPGRFQVPAGGGWLAVRYNELRDCVLRLEASHDGLVKALKHAEHRLNALPHCYADTNFAMIREALGAASVVHGDPEALAKLKGEQGEEKKRV